MDLGGLYKVSFPRETLTHQDVLDLGNRVRREARRKVIVLDLRATEQTTTAALAALILLRRRQIANGGDLLLLGLSGKAHYLYEILRLSNILPRRPCVSPRRMRGIRDLRPRPGKQPIHYTPSADREKQAV